LEKTKVLKILDRAILFSLYVVAFELPISKGVIESFSILAIFCFIAVKIIKREGIPGSHINFSIFVYLLICFLSIFISSNFKISFRTFFDKTLQNAAFFFVASEWLNSERRMRNFVYILLASSFFLGIDGIYQHFTHTDFIRHRPYFGIPRIHATFGAPSDFGCYLSAVIPFTLIAFFGKFNDKKYLKFIFLCLFILLFICLMLTVSRGSWFAFIAFMLLICIWIKALGMLFLIIGLFIIITQQFYDPYLRERLTKFFILEEQSSKDRLMIWGVAKNMFISRPWVGVGIGTFMFNFDRFLTKVYPYGTPYAHNCYLQMAAETGIIGLVSFLTILALFFYKGIKILTNKKMSFSFYILLAILASVLGYSVQMGLDTNFYSLDLGMLFWLLLGAGVAAMKLASVVNSTNVKGDI